MKRETWRQKQKRLTLLARRKRKRKGRAENREVRALLFAVTSRAIELKHRARRADLIWNRKRYTLVLPPRLSLRDCYDDVIDFASDLRLLSLQFRKPVYLDFSQVTYVSPGACLVLVAEVYRAHVLVGRRLVHGNYPPDDAIRRRLIDMGFYDMIDVRDPDAKLSQDETRMDIRFATSNLVDPSIAKGLRVAFEIGRHAIARPARRKLFEGVKEAMNNAFQHAYPIGWKPELPVLPRRWWLAGSITANPDEMMIMFYDQGVGIPATLPRTFPEQFQSFIAALGIREFGDAHIIKAATVIQRTATKKSHRGYGLQNIKDAVQICRSGELRVLSGKGEYVYHADGSEKLIDRVRPLGGTLIQWRVSTASVEEAKPDEDLQDSH